MAHTLEIFSSSIVVVGNFNPAIFSPDWLVRNKLIGEGDADATRGEDQKKRTIVSGQVTAFEADWFALQVLDNKFTLTNKSALSPALKDLAVGVFQLVPHTPVAAVGLNFMGHFKLTTTDEFHRVGDVLAPKDIWKDLYPDEMSGVADLTIRIQHGTRDKGAETNDEKRISVQPSDKIKGGIYLGYNDHHDVSVMKDDLRPAERAATIIDTQWESAWQDAVRVFDSVLSKTLKKPD